MDVSHLLALLPSVPNLIVCLLICTGIWLFLRTKESNLPPGPYGLPVIGFLPFMGKQPFVTFRDLSKKYGDVVCVNMAGSNLLVLNSYEVIRECFVSTGEFAGRIVSEKSFFWWIVDGLGIAQDEGPTWREHRRFALHTLRDFGFGKLSLENRVQEIGGDLISGLESAKGTPYNPLPLLANSAFNVILYLTTDKHFDQDDPDFVLIRSSIRRILSRLTGIQFILQTPLSKILPLKWTPHYSDVAAVKTSFHNLTSKYIKEHEDTFDENNLRDFIDVFLQEMKKDAKEGRSDTTTFIVGRLRAVMLNLFLAGTETVSNTLYWALKILMHRPDIQVKIHDELDEVVGHERLPSILDRPNLHYLDAFVLELLRFSTIAPLGLPHSNPEPAVFNGYNIPARTIVMANIWAVHNDPKMFPEPDKFDPERFLDPQFRSLRRDRVITFSIGKRSCLGESLARMELFIFLAMMLQKFSFRPPEGEQLHYEQSDNFLRLLTPFNICPMKRKV